MKKYIGTKQIMAAPMTYGQAHKEGLIRENAYVEEYDERPGYLVEYADGYKSWSPADVFEAAYKVAETPLDRVNIEIADVMTRTNKLGDFIYNRNEGKDFQAMPLGTRAFLVAQHQTMGAKWCSSKCRRISRLTLSPKCSRSLMRPSVLCWPLAITLTMFRSASYSTPEAAPQIRGVRQ